MHAYMHAHTFTCEAHIHMQSVHTRAYTHMHAYMFTHTHTPSHHQLLAQWLSPESQLCGRGDSWGPSPVLGLLVGKGSEVPSGTQPSGSAELQGLLKVEDSQRRPAASPPGPLAPFLKAELPSPRCPSRSSCTPRAPRRPLSSAGLTALREGPPCGGDAAKGGLEQGAPRSC